MNPLHGKKSVYAITAALFFCLILPVCFVSASGERTIRVGIFINKPPYSFLHWSDQGAHLRGACVDILDQISHYSGLKFEYVKYTNDAVQLQGLNSGHIDIVGQTVIAEGHILADRLDFVPLGLNLTSALFVHKSIPANVHGEKISYKRVAMMGFNDHRDFLPIELNDDTEIYPFSTPLEALKTLEKGFVDAYIAPSEQVATYLIREEGFENIRRERMFAINHPLGIGVKKTDETLYQDLVQAFAQVKVSGKLDQIQAKWFPMDDTPTFLKKHRHAVFLSIVLVVLAFVAVMTWARQLKKQVGRITGKFKVSELRYRNLIESAPDMMFVITRTGKIFHMNKEARVIMSFAFDENLTPPCLEDLIFPADRKKLTDFLSSLFACQKASGEFHFKDRTAGYREIDIAATLMPEDRDIGVHACLFARDVTEKNRIERDLVQADKMAIIGQMAADVAHEINNPIGIVQTNIEVILARGWYTKEAEEFLKACKRNTLRAGKYTRDLLAVARPRTPEMGRLDLWELLNTSLDLLGGQLSDVVIKKQTRGRPAVIEGDRNLIQQVLVNLLLNASAAMKGCSNPLISIMCVVPEGESMVKLSVEDKGIGIPRKNLIQVFEPFFTQGKKEGFGLGLFVSKRIIENHNGVIYAESQVNQGSLFVIELPLVKTQG